MANLGRLCIIAAFIGLLLGGCSDSAQEDEKSNTAAAQRQVESVSGAPGQPAAAEPVSRDEYPVAESSQATAPPADIAARIDRAQTQHRELIRRRDDLVARIESQQAQSTVLLTEMKAQAAELHARDTGTAKGAEGAELIRFERDARKKLEAALDADQKLTAELAVVEAEIETVDDQIETLTRELGTLQAR